MNILQRLAGRYPDYERSFALAAMCGLLALILALELLWLGRSGPSSAPPATKTPPSPPAEQRTDGEAFQLPNIEGFAQFVERPLFLEGRRPVAEAEQSASPEGESTGPLTLKLMGVMLTPAGETALLADPAGRYQRAGKGATVGGGWQLIELQPDRAILQQGEEREELPLLKPKPKATPPRGHGRGIAEARRKPSEPEMQEGDQGEPFVDEPEPDSESESDTLDGEPITPEDEE